MIWAKLIIVTFLDAVATVDVLTASYNDVKLSKFELCILNDYRFERINNKQTRPGLLVKTHFTTCLLPEIPRARDIAFIHRP